MKVFVSERAPYIADRNPRAAENILQRMDEKFSQLSNLPFIGRERSSLAAGLRSIVSGNYVILYSVGDVRVIDGRMDMDEEFRR